MFVVQTHDERSLSSRLVLCLRAEGESLHVRVEEDVERLAGSAVDLVVGGDVELVEEGLVGGSSQGVVEAQVERVAVSGKGEAVFQVCFGPVVLDVVCVDLGSTTQRSPHNWSSAPRPHEPTSADYVPSSTHETELSSLSSPTSPGSSLPEHDRRELPRQARRPIRPFVLKSVHVF